MRALRTLLLAAACFAAFAAPAAADELNTAWGDGVEVMAADEMNELRGGFAIAPGVNLNFGATITTYVNNVPVLVTQLTWTEFGAYMQQTMGETGQDLRTLTPDQLAELGLDGLGGLGGIIINDENGITALAHNVTDGALQGIIINNAMGRDLRQEIDISMELPGFEGMQAEMLAERLGMSFMDDLTPFLD